MRLATPVTRCKVTAALTFGLQHPSSATALSQQTGTAKGLGFPREKNNAGEVFCQ